MTTVLIVDDKSYNIDDIRDVLSDLMPEINIITANDGGQAIEYIEQDDSIDLVITDLVMTKVDGMEVLSAARKKNQSLPVIIVTVNESLLSREKAYQLGAFDCIGRILLGSTFLDEVVAKAKSALEYRKSTLTLEYIKRYFDPTLYTEIQNNQTLLVPQNRMITTVFCDVRGFSQLYESLKNHPHLISGFIREYLEKASQIIFENKGVLDKYLGGGVMALFGAVGEDKYPERDSILALKTAIALNNEFNKTCNNWRVEWTKATSNKIDIGLGCGIETGEAIVGNMATSFRDHFTAVGTSVNIAARLGQCAEKGKIVLSNNAKENIGVGFNYKEIIVNKIKELDGTAYTAFELIG